MGQHFDGLEKLKVLKMSLDLKLWADPQSFIEKKCIRKISIYKDQLTGGVSAWV